MAKTKTASKSKSSSRPQSTGALAQPQLASATSNILTAFCDIVQDSQVASTSSSASSSESTSQDPHLYAQADCAVTADTVRIFNANSGNLVARWASSSESDRVKSIAWVTLSAPSAAESERPFAKQRKRKQSSSHAEGQQATLASVKKAGKITYALALGLSSGQIQLVNPANSAVISTLSHPSSSSPIASLSFPSLPQDLLSQASNSLLWSCGADGQIRLWSLPDPAGSGGHLIATHQGAGAGWSTLEVGYQGQSTKTSGNAVATTSESIASFTAEILVAQHAIQCYTVNLPLAYVSSPSRSPSTLNATLVATFTGHTSKVRQLCWLQPSKGSLRFLSIAEGDRYVNSWAARPDSAPIDGRLHATLTLDEAVAQVVVSPRRDAALAITISGVADLFLFWPEAQASPASGKKKAKLPVASLQRTTLIICPPANKDPISTARFLRADASIIRVSRGMLRPSFESIHPRNADDSFRPEVFVMQNPSTASSGQSSDTKLGKPATYSEHMHSAVIGGEPSTSKATLTNGVPAEIDPVLAERIKGMGFEPANDERTFDTILSQADDLARQQRRVLTKGASREAKSASISQSLVQALHSSDVKLLESCLENKDTNVIRASIKRIPNHLVIVLVNALVERVSRKKAGTQAGSGGLDAVQGQRLVFWLRTVLLYHLPYLITLPDLVAQLASLHAMLEARMAFHDQLLSLNGRLDLVVAQIELKASASKALSIAASQEVGPTGTAKYIEGEEGSETSDDEVAAADEDEEEVEDLVLDPRTSTDTRVAAVKSKLNGADEDGESDDEDDEDEIPTPIKKKKNGLSTKPRINGFVDIEAEESGDEGSDIDASLRKTMPNGFGSHEDEEDEEDDDDAEDLDAYESDFINDSDEESGEDSGEE